MEFLKCLDLFAREVVSRTELLTLLENIFTSRHAHLLDDLKILLNNRGTLDNLVHNNNNNAGLGFLFVLVFLLVVGPCFVSHAPRFTLSLLSPARGCVVLAACVRD